MGAVVRGGGTAYPSRMGDAAKARRTDAELWAALEALPEGQKGEILDGELHVQPRPRSGHAFAGFSVGRRIANTYEDGPVCHIFFKSIYPEMSLMIVRHMITK